MYCVGTEINRINTDRDPAAKHGKSTSCYNILYLNNHHLKHRDRNSHLQIGTVISGDG
ncbi:hypothetical protein Hanom_Chr00s000004g01609661 [Helianthus anomalus]